MDLSRRTLIGASAGASLVAALSSAFSYAKAAPKSPEQFAALQKRWGDIITGRHLIKDGDPKFAEAIKELDEQVADLLKDLDTSTNRTTVFKSIDLAEENSPTITKTPRGVLSIATAWATPGSKYYQDKDALSKAIDGFADFLRLRYNPEQTPYGNWWDWQSGGARAVGDFMCLVHDEMPQDVLDAAAEGLNHFVWDPWEQYAGSPPEPDKVSVSTGANRLDLCRAVACGAIASEDSARLEHAIKGLADTWQYVTEGDGFHVDGSYVQHSTIPYTGSYGNVLISGLANMFQLVAGTEFDVDPEGIERVYELVDQAFLPVIVEGQILDSVRGRSVSRITEPASSHAQSIMVAILQLAVGAPAETRERWRATLRGWIKRNQYDDLASSSMIPRIAILNDLMQGSKTLPPSTTPRMFPEMDRLVHRSEGWAMAIAMCSNRISWYEYGNDENGWASRTGLGMRYTYILDDMSQYEDDFWPTLDYAAPTGTTVDSSPLKLNLGPAWGGGLPQNEWTGGLHSGKHSMAGMDLIGPKDKEVDSKLHARRSWVASPKVMIEAVSDVSTDAKPAITVVEHRNLGEKASASLLVDGETVTNEAEFANPSWAHLEGVGGYVFLTDAKIKAKVESRTGTWHEINSTKTGADEPPTTRVWATMHFLHEDGLDSGAWVLLPKASVDETKAAAASLQARSLPIATLIQNDAEAQIARTDDGAIGYSIWSAGTYDGITFAQPVVMMTKPHERGMLVTAAEPTQQGDKIEITIPGQWTIEKTPGVSAEITDDAIKLTFDMAERYGRSRSVLLLAPTSAPDPTPSRPKPEKPKPSKPHLPPSTGN